MCPRAFHPPYGYLCEPCGDQHVLQNPLCNMDPPPPPPLRTWVAGGGGGGGKFPFSVTPSNPQNKKHTEIILTLHFICTPASCSSHVSFNVSPVWETGVLRPWQGRLWDTGAVIQKSKQCTGGDDVPEPKFPSVPKNIVLASIDTDISRGREE